MGLTIRRALPADAPALCELLDQLGYGGAEEFLAERLAQLGGHPDERVLIALRGGEVKGFLSLHFIPQIGLAGDFARISYFCVSRGARGQGVGRELLHTAEDLARERGCDRMEVHCHQRRAGAQRFYRRHEYQESPKYLIKGLQ